MEWLRVPTTHPKPWLAAGTPRYSGEMADTKLEETTSETTTQDIAPDVLRVERDVLLRAAAKVAERRAELFERLAQ